MKFTKYNNPNKKRTGKRSTYSKQYKEDRYNEMCELLANCKDEKDKEILRKAYSISINP